MSLSGRILADNAAVFDAMVGHRLVGDIAADRLPAPVFDRYLACEGAFVETAIRIFAFAVAKAPTFADHLIAVLDAVANRQVGFFGKAFSARGIDPGAADFAHSAVAAFRDGMLAIARDGTYLDIVAAMFAAQAHWLRDRVDAAGPDLNEAEKSRLSRIFGHVLKLKIAFHEAAYA